MKLRLFCLLIAVGLFGFATMASAQPLIGVNCLGNVCTITETLYFTGNQTCGSNPPEGCNNTGNPGVATGTQNYVAPSAGNPTGTNLVNTTWDAVYTFDTYGFFNTGYALAGATLMAFDSSTGNETLSQTSGANHYYGWGVGVVDAFTLNSNFESSPFLVDNNTEGSDAGTTTGTTGYLSCAGNPPPSGSNAPAEGAEDSTHCVYLASGGAAVNESGFSNTSMSIAAPGALTSNIAGTANVYEEVNGADTLNGPTSNSDAPNGAAGASELVLTFTYDLPSNGTPEPATLLLMGTGLSFVASRLRRNKSGAAK